MAHRIKCYTLFDITNSGVRQRNKPPEGVDLEKFIYQRNTQNNFDTILQLISLRSQPEIYSYPNKQFINTEEFTEFGFFYIEEKLPIWVFEFEVHHHSVFDDGIETLGYLYSDCDNVPMVKCGTEYQKLDNLLDINPETKNIHFEIL